MSNVYSMFRMYDPLLSDLSCSQLPCTWRLTSLWVGSYNPPPPSSFLFHPFLGVKSFIPVWDLKFVKRFCWGFTRVLRIVPVLNIIFPLYTISYINHIIHCHHFYPEDGSVWPSKTSADFSTRTQKQIKIKNSCGLPLKF